MRIKVSVKTGSKNEGIEKINDAYYIIKVKSLPYKGKANQAVLKLIKKYFKKQAYIISGFLSEDKIVELE